MKKKISKRAIDSILSEARKIDLTNPFLVQAIKNGSEDFFKLKAIETLMECDYNCTRETKIKAIQALTLSIALEDLSNGTS